MLDKSDIDAFKTTCQMIEGNIKAISDSTIFD